MPRERYLMRDLNGRKIDDIMRFNVALRREQPRAWIEFGVFAAAVVGFAWALAVTT